MGEGEGRGPKLGSDSGGGSAHTPLAISSAQTQQPHLCLLLSPFQVINFNGAIHLVTATWENKVMAGVSGHIHCRVILLLETERRNYGNEPRRSVQKIIRRNSGDGRQA